MVRFWDEALKKGIKKTRWQIKQAEKLGNGDDAMEYKETLKQQIRHKELKEKETGRKI